MKRICAGTTGKPAATKAIYFSSTSLNFFDNIPHTQLKEAIAEKITDDPEAVNFINGLIDEFKIDVSYLSDADYEECLNEVYDSLKYRQIDRSLLTGEKFMGKSVGIGSQISQISGVFYPTRLDNYCKIVKGLKYYGRYMDDIYIIHRSKAYLQDLLKEMKEVAAGLGLPVNDKKTQIIKLSHGFTFLKIKYTLTETGRILKRVSPERITRERRKLKKYRKLLDEGRMPYPDIEQAYRSWRGSVKNFSTYRSLKNMDKLYNDLFIKPFLRGGDYNDGRREREEGTADPRP